MKDADIAPLAEESRAGLAAILKAVAQGLEESRRMLGAVEHALLQSPSVAQSNGRLQDIDRIGQRLGDLESLLSLLASEVTVNPAPPSADILTAGLKLAEIRALIPGRARADPQQSDIPNAADRIATTDPILF